MPVNVTCQVSLSPMTMSHFASLLALSPVFVWSVQYAFVSAWVWFWCNVAFCQGGCGRGGRTGLLSAAMLLRGAMAVGPILGRSERSLPFIGATGLVLVGP